MELIKPLGLLKCKTNTSSFFELSTSPMTWMIEDIRHYCHPTVFLVGPGSHGRWSALLGSMSKWRNCLLEKVSTVNYAPRKDECSCEIEDGVHKLSPNRMHRSESLMCHYCSLKRALWNITIQAWSFPAYAGRNFNSIRRESTRPLDSGALRKMRTWRV